MFGSSGLGCACTGVSTPGSEALRPPSQGLPGNRGLPNRHGPLNFRAGPMSGGTGAPPASGYCTAGWKGCATGSEALLVGRKGGWLSGWPSGMARLKRRLGTAFGLRRWRVFHTRTAVSDPRKMSAPVSPRPMETHGVSVGVGLGGPEWTEHGQQS